MLYGYHTAGQQAYMLWSGFNRYMRGLDGRFFRPTYGVIDGNYQGYILDIAAFSALDSVDYSDEEDVADRYSDNYDDGDGNMSPTFSEHGSDHGAPFTAPYRIYAPYGQRAAGTSDDGGENSAEALHDIAYRYDLSPNGPGTGGFADPAAGLSLVARRELNFIALRRRRRHLRVRQDLRNSFNDENSPLSNHLSQTHEVLAASDNDNDEDNGPFARLRCREQRAVAATRRGDITATRPPQFILDVDPQDLQRQQQQSSEQQATDKDENDPFV